MTTNSCGEISHALEADPESIIVEIVATIAAERGTSICELSPLSEWVDVDALVRLVTVANRDTAQHVTAQFRYHEHDVRVRSDGTVELTPAPARRGDGSE